MSWRRAFCSPARPPVRVLLVLIPGWWFVLLFSGCETPAATGTVPPGAAFVANAEERFYSEILQGNQRVLLMLELVDDVRPPQRDHFRDDAGCWIPAGKRRLQFRVVLPAVGWNNGNGREARGVFDVELAAGHRYRLAGRYAESRRMFQVVDLDTGAAIAPPLDFGFFAPVDAAKANVPLIIFIK